MQRPRTACRVLLMTMVVGLTAESRMSAASSQTPPVRPPGSEDSLPSTIRPEAVRRVFFELRLAEREPIRGLTIDAAVKDTGQKIYPHYETVLSNAELLHAAVVDETGRHAIEIVLTDEGAEKLAGAASRHRGRPLVVILDGEIVSVLTAGAAPRPDRLVFDSGLSESDAVRIAAGLNKS